jgi:hypothetical protein
MAWKDIASCALGKARRRAHAHDDRHSGCRQRGTDPKRRYLSAAAQGRPLSLEEMIEWREGGKKAADQRRSAPKHFHQQERRLILHA